MNELMIFEGHEVEVFEWRNFIQSLSCWSVLRYGNEHSQRPHE